MFFLTFFKGFLYYVLEQRSKKSTHSFRNDSMFHMAIVLLWKKNTKEIEVHFWNITPNKHFFGDSKKIKLSSVWQTKKIETLKCKASKGAEVLLQYFCYSSVSITYPMPKTEKYKLCLQLYFCRKKYLFIVLFECCQYIFFKWIVIAIRDCDFHG